MVSTDLANDTPESMKEFMGKIQPGISWLAPHVLMNSAKAWARSWSNGL